MKKCPNCFGRGWNMEDDDIGNYGQMECQYCDGTGMKA